MAPTPQNHRAGAGNALRPWLIHGSTLRLLSPCAKGCFQYGVRLPGSKMKLNPQDLEKIASLTLDHYNKRAEDFWQGTRDHNRQTERRSVFTMDRR